MLTSDGKCRPPPTPTRDWDPMLSPAAELLQQWVVRQQVRRSRPVARFEFHLPCLARANITKQPPSETLAERLLRPDERQRFSNVYHCADKIFKEGKAHEALVSCEAPGLRPVYERVRPIQVAAVVLLALGIASLLGRSDTRRTVHGWALASHAASLLAANALQVAWFFAHQPDATCEKFAYTIYYFMVAAGVWLNVVSINMARGFRQPLGARMAGAAGGQGWSLVWQMAAWSAYGWGFPALMTLFAIIMFLNRAHVQNRGWEFPTFFETRTCLSENKLFKKTKDKLELFEAADIGLLLKRELPHKVSGKISLASIYYYYIPMSILVMVNAACLVSTIIIIRKLQRNTSAVQRMGTSTGVANKGLRTALLYVKLLVLAGLVEIVLEVIMWKVRSANWDDSNWLDSTSNTLESVYQFNIAVTVLDVARALAVLWLSAGRRARRGRVARAAQRVMRTLRRRAHTHELTQARPCDSDGLSDEATTSSTTVTTTSL